MKWPIWGIPLAVLEGATTGTPWRWAIGSAAKACWERVGPIRAITPLAIRRLKAAIELGSSEAPSSTCKLSAGDGPGRCFAQRSARTRPMR